jgi:hypothetical protein
MPRFRFSLLALFGFVAFVSVGCAAMSSGSDLWCAGIETVLIVSLIATSVVGACDHGEYKVFCVGFAVVGWVHLLAQGVDTMLPTSRIVTFDTAS